MAARQSLIPSILAIFCCALVSIGAQAPQNQKPPVKMPDPGVPQLQTLEAPFVRIAYNNEGYISLGYRLANTLVGQEWILLEVGLTVRDGQPNYKLERSNVSLTLPDNRTVPLPTNPEYLDMDLRAIEGQATVINDSINYFPPSARDACRIGFFAPLDSRAMAYDVVELSSMRGCVGRLYFKIPGGLQYGQHFLNVKFANSVVRAPFRILTKDEEKFLNKNWKDIKKQVEEAFKKKK